MIRRILLLTWLVAGQETKTDKLITTRGEPATFDCGIEASPGDQWIKVKFTGIDPEGSGLVVAAVKKNGLVEVKPSPNSKILYNGGKVTIQDVDLENEGKYECIVTDLATYTEKTSLHEVVVRIKPTVEEIDNISEVKDIINYSDTHGERKQVTVAKCIVRDAKPKAEIRWVFPNGLEIAEEITEDQEKGRQFDSISTLKIIPEASYDNQVVKCIVKHPELGKDIEKEAKLNIQYSPRKPELIPNLSKNTLTCRSNANPEPKYSFIMPDGSNILEPTVELQNFSNPNSTYKCTVQNDHGSNNVVMTVSQLQQVAQEKPLIANVPIIVAIGVAVLLILILGCFVIYKFFLNPRQTEKNYVPYGGYNTTSKSDQIVTTGGGGGMYDEGHPRHDYDQDSTAEDAAPILSPNSASYHAERRQSNNIRHSPSRAGPPQSGYYEDPDYEEDDMIDDAHHRYADYTPGQAYAQKAAPNNQNYRNDFGSEMV